MDPNTIPGLSLIPEPWRSRLVLTAILSPIAGRVYKAIVNGGGIKGILSAIWLGTNTPEKKP